MSDMITLKYKNCITVIVTAFLLFGTSANGQTKIAIDSLANTSKWIDNDTKKELKAINGYQEIKVMYDQSLAQYDSLKRESERCDSIKNVLLCRQNELRNHLKSIYSSGSKPKTFLKCDTTLLIHHEGLYGDNETECQQKALLVYHRAEAVLSERYDKGRVEKAREALESVKTYLPDECAELDRRLEQYGARSDSLRSALKGADPLDRLDPTKYKDLASYSLENYTKQFIDKLAEKLYPELLVPSEYPYLYDILSKAMSVIMDDPRNDITELIEEL